MNRKIVFCGGGKMAEGIIRDALRENFVSSEDIIVHDPASTRRKYLIETYGVKAVTDVESAVKDANIIIIAVTPKYVPSVTTVLKPIVNDQTIILSIAAGITTESLAEQLGTRKKIVRVVPNTLGQSGYGYSAYYLNDQCEENDKTVVEKLLSTLGQLMPIPEDMFNMFSSFSNVGPLWLYKTVEALIDAGVYIGLSRENARNIVLMNMLGTATVLKETGEHPAAKVDQMASPGGVTIEAWRTLQKTGFSSAIIDSVTAGFEKTNMLD